MENLSVTLLKSSSGQASIEYMMVFGLALLLSVPFITKAQTSIVDLRSNSQILDVQNSADRIESAAETVNAAGAPAKRTFSIKMPRSVEKVYVNQYSFIYTVKAHDGKRNISKQFEFKIAGDLPSEEGRHIVAVTAKSDEVEFSEVS